jgi:hypothetical protein
MQLVFNPNFSSVRVIFDRKLYREQKIRIKNGSRYIFCSSRSKKRDTQKTLELTSTVITTNLFKV